jgi:hypothetical protein
MKEQNQKKIKCAKLFCSMLVGNISWAPGTWGSLLSLPILFFLAKSDLLFISVNLFIFYHRSLRRRVHRKKMNPSTILLGL